MTMTDIIIQGKKKSKIRTILGRLINPVIWVGWLVSLFLFIWITGLSCGIPFLPIQFALLSEPHTTVLHKTYGILYSILYYFPLFYPMLWASSIERQRSTYFNILFTLVFFAPIAMLIFHIHSGFRFDKDAALGYLYLFILPSYILYSIANILFIYTKYSDHFKEE